MYAMRRSSRKVARLPGPCITRVACWNSAPTPSRLSSIRIFAKDKTIIVYCASGGRAALAGKLLKEMGYGQVHNLGAFKDWVENGGAIEKPIDMGM